MSDGARPLLHSRAFDLACAVPLAIVFGFALAGDVLLAARQWPSAKDWQDWFVIADEIATLAFFGVQIALLLTRHLPIAKSEGAWPRAVAVLGANCNFALLLLPHVMLGAAWVAASFVLTIAGTIASVAVLAWLGRSFSIFPEARRLVESGPYRLVRHPLYLAEIVSTLGIMLQYRQPWAALIALAAIAFQFRRMDYEEAVLRQAYPEYEAYGRKTARLVPGVY